MTSLSLRKVFAVLSSLHFVAQHFCMMTSTGVLTHVHGLQLAGKKHRSRSAGPTVGARELPLLAGTNGNAGTTAAAAAASSAASSSAAVPPATATRRLAREVSIATAQAATGSPRGPAASTGPAPRPAERHVDLGAADAARPADAPPRPRVPVPGPPRPHRLPVVGLMAHCVGGCCCFDTTALVGANRDTIDRRFLAAEEAGKDCRVGAACCVGFGASVAAGAGIGYLCAPSATGCVTGGGMAAILPGGVFGGTGAALLQSGCSEWGTANSRFEEPTPQQVLMALGGHEGLFPDY
ncbi:unnamed protein product [Amoebophrya sp. A120]|nr:unnamed protein product [Amoebophrya sp. A120]|eukprot:GSA120T00024776001.1